MHVTQKYRHSSSVLQSLKRLHSSYVHLPLHYQQIILTFSLLLDIIFLLKKTINWFFKQMFWNNAEHCVNK